MSVPPTGASDAQSSQAVAAPQDARPQPACAGTALETFERQVLVFPLLVVVLACASFLFGGTCAAWQWWTAVAAVVAAPFVRKDRRRAALGAVGLFAFLLFALRFLLPPVFWDVAECDDMSSCHLPMVQLLIEGWNPVSDPTMANILASLDLDVWGMAPLHIAFMPKTLAVFSAVAYTFIGDPRALTFPLPAFLWIGVLLSAIRLFRSFPRWALVAALVGVLPMVSWQMPVDLGLAYASCGLLLTLQESLKRKECEWISLAVWSAWMVLLKPNGAMGALVFLFVFAIVKLWEQSVERKRFIVRFAECLATLVLLAALILWNPMGTSWKEFGHPLYPLRTVDAVRHPAKDLTWDLNVGNDDYNKMGRIGLLAYAYLSPRTTTAFYRWKLCDPSFKPEARRWTFREFPDNSVRMGILATFAILLLLRKGRPWALACLVLLLSVPRQYAGYTRYQPWLSALGCLAVALAVEWATGKLNFRFANGIKNVFAGTVFLTVFVWAWGYAREVECAAAENAIVRNWIRPRFSVPQESVLRGNPFGADPSFRVIQLNYRENQCRLFVKQSGRNGTTKVLSVADWIPPEDLAFLREECNDAESIDGAMKALARAWGDRTLWKNNSPEVMLIRRKLLWRWTKGWIETPFGYYVPDDEEAEFLHEYYDEMVERSNFSIWRKYIMRAKMAFHAWFVTYPNEVFRRLRMEGRK